jgi:uncharacterized protein
MWRRLLADTSLRRVIYRKERQMPYDTYFFWIYKDANAEWRWRLYAPNEKKIAVSGEGFSSLRACEESIALVKRVAPGAPTRYHDSARR